MEKIFKELRLMFGGLELVALLKLLTITPLEVVPNISLDIKVLSLQELWATTMLVDITTQSKPSFGHSVTSGISKVSTFGSLIQSQTKNA